MQINDETSAKKFLIPFFRHATILTWTFDNSCQKLVKSPIFDLSRMNSHYFALLVWCFSRTKSYIAVCDKKMITRHEALTFLNLIHTSKLISKTKITSWSYRFNQETLDLESSTYLKTCNTTSCDHGTFHFDVHLSCSYSDRCGSVIFLVLVITISFNVIFRRMVNGRRETKLIKNNRQLGADQGKTQVSATAMNDNCFTRCSYIFFLLSIYFSNQSVADRSS